MLLIPLPFFIPSHPLALGKAWITMTIVLVVDWDQFSMREYISTHFPPAATHNDKRTLLRIHTTKDSFLYSRGMVCLKQHAIGLAYRSQR